MRHKFLLLSTALIVIAGVVIQQFITVTDRLSYSPNYNRVPPNDIAETFDFIIIGAGSAGSVLANRLSKHVILKNYLRYRPRVLLLEAGPSDNILGVTLPVGFHKLYKSNIDWNFTTVPQKHLDNRRMYWPRGKVIGGCSSINAMIYQRGNKKDYDQWNELLRDGNDWTYTDVLPYFKKSENQQSKDLETEYHGFDGEWIVRKNPAHHKSMDDLIEAVHEVLNVPKNSDFNSENQIGVGKNQINVDSRGRRFSAADAFLPPYILASRYNLHVRVNAQVEKIIFDGKRAIGVIYHDKANNRRVKVHASKEIILSAGTIHSPQLLMLSGIGPKKHLQGKGINVINDLPGVGQNLQDHVVAGVVYNATFKKSFLENTKDFNQYAVSLQSEESLYTFLQWLLLGKGPFASNAAEVNAFIQSPIAVKRKEELPDMQLIGLPGMMMQHGFTTFLDHKDGISFGAALLNPKSTGTITLQSDNPYDAPLIDPNYFAEKVDEDRMYETFKLLRKVIDESMTLNSKYDLFEVVPGKNASSEADIKKAIRAQIESLYHPVGTCKMGNLRDNMAVVDKELRVIGVKGLRVVDSSIIPIIPRANTQAPTIMIAEKVSDIIKKQYALVDNIAE